MMLLFATVPVGLAFAISIKGYKKWGYREYVFMSIDWVLPHQDPSCSG